MAEIIIRDIDRTVIEVLRARAAAAGTTVEEQARGVLTRAVFSEDVHPDRSAAVSRLGEIRRKIGRITGPSVLDDLRNDRDRNAR